MFATPSPMSEYRRPPADRSTRGPRRREGRPAAWRSPCPAMPHRRGRRIGPDHRRRAGPAAEFSLTLIGFLDENGGIPTQDQQPAGPRHDHRCLGSGAERAVDVVIIAVPSLPSVEIRRLAREAADAGAIVRYLPSNKRPTAEGPRMRDLRHLRLNLNSDERERVDASERAGAASIGRRRRDEDLLHPGRECSASLAPRVVLVGGAGFVGSVLARRLLDRRYRVTVVDALVYGDGGVRDLHAHPAFEVVKADLRDTDIISRSCRGAFAVVHLGGLVGDPACALDEQLTLDINLTATRTIAEAAREAGARRFVFASSCAVYGPATTF